jgi:small subunit ribosomal protein S28e
MTIPAQVVDVGAKMGIKGVSRVRCKILDGRDRDKVVVRNVVGPIKNGDVILLKETAMEAEAKFAAR